jgi:hypothetical protein
MAAASTLVPEIGGRLGHEERTVQTHIDNPPPTDLRQMVKDAVAKDRGIVRHAVDPAKMTDVAPFLPLPCRG